MDSESTADLDLGLTGVDIYMGILIANEISFSISICCSVALKQSLVHEAVVNISVHSARKITGDHPGEAT